MKKFTYSIFCWMILCQASFCWAGPKDTNSASAGNNGGVFREQPFVVNPEVKQGISVFVSNIVHYIEERRGSPLIVLEYMQLENSFVAFYHETSDELAQKLFPYSSNIGLLKILGPGLILGVGAELTIAASIYGFAISLGLSDSDVAVVCSMAMAALSVVATWSFTEVLKTMKRLSLADRQTANIFRAVKQKIQIEFIRELTDVFKTKYGISVAFEENGIETNDYLHTSTFRAFMLLTRATAYCIAAVKPIYAVN